MSHLSDGMFTGADIESISVPSSVKSIGENAFAGCRSLKSITLSSVKTIPRNAFSGCPDLETAVLSSAEELNPYAFYDCVNLSNVKIPVARIIEDSVFGNCSSLTKIDLPETLERLNSCFGGAGIRELYLNGADTLEFNLYNSYIEKVTISNNIVHLDGTFSGIRGEYEEWREKDEPDYSDLVVLFEKDSQVKRFGGTFRYAPIQELILPRSITRIDAGAFYNSTIKKLYLTSESAPTLYGRLSTLAEETGELIIYVPEEKEDLYKYWASPNWTHYADIMVPYNYAWTQVP